MRILIISFMVGIFLLGLGLGASIDQYIYGLAPERNIPFSQQQSNILSNDSEQVTSTKNSNFLDLIRSPNSEDVPSPSDYLSEDQIHVYKDQIVIDLADAQWSTFTDTNSMDPVLDKGANAIQIVPSSTDEIQAGDIISYESKYADGVFIHRVVEIGEDSIGWYCILKGDNNAREDPGRIRFEQILRKTVGILY